MNWFFHFFDILSKLGWMVMTPVLLALCGRAMGLGFGKALRSGVRVTASLIGLTLVVNTLGGNLASVTSDIVTHHGLALEVADVGWNVSVAIASASRISAWIIPMYIVINWGMLLFRATRTLNLDLWNFWHVAFMGALVQNLTGSFAYGMVAAGVLVVALLVLSDQCGPSMARYCQVPGVSVAHGFATAAVPFALVSEHLLNVIPGRPRLVLDRSCEPKEALASPAAWCVVLGVLLGILAGRDVYGVAQLAITFGAMAFLAPWLGQALTGALGPVSETISVFSREKLKMKGGVYLGLSPASGLGNGTVMVVTLMVAPIVTFLAGALPGNRFVAQGDMVMLPYLMVLIVAVCRGDLMRSLLAGVLSTLAMLWCSSSLAELFTLSAVTVNAEAYEKLGVISNLSDGGNPLAWLTLKAGSFGFAGMALLVVAAITLAVWNHNRIVSGADVSSMKKKARHAPQGEQAAQASHRVPGAQAPEAPETPEAQPQEEGHSGGGQG